jgi:hypothetical protein
MKKNRDFASDRVLMLNIIQYLKKRATARVIAAVYKQPKGLIEFKNTMCQLKFSPKHNYLKMKYYKIKY